MSNDPDREMLDRIIKGAPVEREAVRLYARKSRKHLAAVNLAKLLAPAEADIAAGRVSSARSFLRKFKKSHGIPE